MKKRLTILTLLIFSFILIGFVHAEEKNLAEFNIDSFNCQQVKDMSTSQDFILPSFIPYTNEIFNVYLEDNFLVGITLEEKKLTEIFCEEKEEKTYDIKIKNEQTIRDIVKSENQLDEFLNKKSSGEIEIKGATFGKNFKQFFVNMGLKIASWFN